MFTVLSAPGFLNRDGIGFTERYLWVLAGPVAGLAGLLVQTVDLSPTESGAATGYHGSTLVDLNSRRSSRSPPTACTLVLLSILSKHSAGHMSAMGSQGNGQCHEHRGYSNPFWGSSFAYHAGLYTSAYSYTPTSEQQATAKQQVASDLLAVKKGRKHPATHRYISVETLRPTKKQLEDFTRKQAPTRRVEPRNCAV